MVNSFNTSHVSINRAYYSTKGGDCKVSIHLMFLLIVSQYFPSTTVTTVSIHLMFLLIVSYLPELLKYSSVSIHLMFLLIQGHLALSLFPLYHKHQEMSLFYRFFTR